MIYDFRLLITAVLIGIAIPSMAVDKTPSQLTVATNASTTDTLILSKGSPASTRQITVSDLAASLPVSVTTRTLWVKPNGSATATGTSLNDAFSLPSMAISNATAGDTIHIMAGSYYEGTNLLRWQNLKIHSETGAEIIGLASTVHDTRAFFTPGDNLEIRGGLLKISMISTNASLAPIAVGIGSAETAVITNFVLSGLIVTNDGFAFRFNHTNLYSGIVRDCVVYSPYAVGIAGGANHNTNSTIQWERVTGNMSGDSILSIFTVKRGFEPGIRMWGMTIRDCVLNIEDSVSFPAVPLYCKAVQSPQGSCVIDGITINRHYVHASSMDVDISGTNVFTFVKSPVVYDARNPSSLTFRRTSIEAFPMKFPINIVSAILLADTNVPAAISMPSNTFAVFLSPTNSLLIRNTTDNSTAVDKILWPPQYSELIGPPSIPSTNNLVHNNHTAAITVTNSGNQFAGSDLRLYSGIFPQAVSIHLNTNLILRGAKLFDESQTNTIYTGAAGTATAGSKIWTNLNGTFSQVGSSVRWITNFNGYWHIMLATGATEAYTNATLYGQYQVSGGAGPAPVVYGDIRIGSAAAPISSVSLTNLAFANTNAAPANTNLVRWFVITNLSEGTAWALPAAAWP